MTAQHHRHPGPGSPLMLVDGVPATADQAAALAVLNYGHFSTLAVDAGRVKGLGLHLDRLVRDAQVVFGKALDPGRVRALIRSAAALLDGPMMLRVTVFDPEPLSDREPSLLITSRPVPARAHGRSDQPATGPRLRTVDYARDNPRVKHLGFFGPLHERRRAQQAGFDDALFVARGRVCEGPTWNIAVLLDEGLIWPDDDCLPGTTRALVQRALDSAVVPWSVRPIQAAELAGARAAFITSAGVGVQPVTSIDTVPLAGDPQLLDLIRAGYADQPGELI